MRTARIHCAIVLIDDDDRSVQLVARLARENSYAVALTVGSAAAARRRDTRMLARLLRSDGWRVDLSVGDWAGIERLTRRPHPDVLMVDVDAQHDAAVALVRHARALAPSLAVVLLTDRADELERALAGISPAPAVLEKPLDYTTLRQLLHANVRPRTTSAIVPLCEATESPSEPQAGRNGR